MDAATRWIAAAAVRHGVVHARRSHGRGVVSVDGRARLQSSCPEARETDVGAEAGGKNLGHGVCGLAVNTDLELEFSRSQSRAQERRRGLSAPESPAAVGSRHLLDSRYGLDQHGCSSGACDGVWPAIHGDGNGTDWLGW